MSVATQKIHSKANTNESYIKSYQGQCKEHIKQKENRKYNAEPTNLQRFINF